MFAFSAFVMSYYNDLLMNIFPLVDYALLRRKERRKKRRKEREGGGKRKRGQ